eukprot:1641046-Pyramimonas_sp.AAC.1
MRALDVYADVLTLQIAHDKSGMVAVAADMLELLASTLRDLELPIAVLKAKVLPASLDAAVEVARGMGKH